MSINTAQAPAADRGRCGYLVPLRARRQDAGSYLLAVGRRPTQGVEERNQVEDQLAALVIGFGAEWDSGMDARVFGLQKDTLAQLPDDLLLREDVAAADWSQPEPAFGPPELVLIASRGLLVFREDVRSRRAGAGTRPDGIPENWFPEGPIWRGARTLILVDLDEQDRALAEESARYALGDLWTASGQSVAARFARIGQAQEWDAGQGQFRSPEETRDRLEMEGLRAADRVGRQYFPRTTLLDSHERRSARTALRARAALTGRTPAREWRLLSRRVLADMLAVLVPGELESFASEIRSNRAEPGTLHERVTRMFRRLLSASRRQVGDQVADRLLGTTRRHRWSGADSLRKKARAPSTEERVIERLERERLFAAMKLTPLESDLIEAREHGIPVTQWAAEQDMPLSEARKLLNDLRLRLKDAMG